MNLRLVATGAQPITLADAKFQCRVEHDDENALIASYVAAAASRLSAPGGRLVIAVGAHTFDLALDRFPAAEIQLLGKVGSVVSVSYTDTDGLDQVVSPDDYEVDTYPDQYGWVVPRAGFSWPATMEIINAVRVRFVISEDLPDEVRQAVRLMVSTWYDDRATGDVQVAYDLVERWRRRVIA